VRREKGEGRREKGEGRRETSEVSKLRKFGAILRRAFDDCRYECV
jgi:hypothetical protein